MQPRVLQVSDAEFTFGVEWAALTAFSITYSRLFYTKPDFQKAARRFSPCIRLPLAELENLLLWPWARSIGASVDGVAPALVLPSLTMQRASFAGVIGSSGEGATPALKNPSFSSGKN